MNGISNRKQNSAIQIAGIIQNYKKVATRTGKPMAVFTVGTFPTKCFDVLVDTAESWATTGKSVLVAGHLSNHEGTIELVAQSIRLAPAAQTDTQACFSQDGHADISAQSQPRTRESSTITEDLSGAVHNVKTITTHSGRPMITFKIGNTSCKAFGDLASTIQAAEGKQIKISARKDSFRGVPEYAVETVKTISGTAEGFRGVRTIPPEQDINEVSHTPEALSSAVQKEFDILDMR